MKTFPHRAALLGLAALLTPYALARRASAAPQHPLECASLSSTGASGDGDSYYPSISGDGRYVAFSSEATNLVPGDTNGVLDVFRRDRLTGATIRVSVSTSGAEADDESYTSYLIAISADGRHVVFTSDATNLVPNDANGHEDVFVRDVLLGSTVRVSVGPNGVEGNDESENASISSDGQRVVFASRATNLLAQLSAPGHVYVHDARTGTTLLASVDSTGTPADGESYYPAISGDGNVVAFLSHAHNLGAGVPPQFIAYAFYLHDFSTGVTRTGVWSPAIVSGDAFAGYASLSHDGRLVAFASDDPELVPGDGNGTADAFVIDVASNVIERVSTSSIGGQGGCLLDFPKISPDGRYVGFESESRTLVPGDSNGLIDSFVHDRLTGATVRSSVAEDGSQMTDLAGPLVSAIARGFSADGRYVVFASSCDDLVAGDHNQRNDVFVQDRGALAPGTFCEAKRDTQDCAPAMSFAGIPSASSSTAFDVAAGPLPEGRLGVLLYGFGPSRQPFAGGVRCVAPPIRRAAVVRSAGVPGPGCTATIAADFNARVRSGADPALVPGTVVYAQYAYRDPGDASGANLGLSDALRFVIQP